MHVPVAVVRLRFAVFILCTALCFRHTENVKIMLFECHAPEAFRKMTQLFVILQWRFFVCFVSVCVFDQSFNRRYDGLLSVLPLPHTCCPFFDLLKRQKMGLPLIISFKFLTIVSIMVISKWIKWHSLVNELCFFFSSYFLWVKKNSIFDVSIREISFIFWFRDE